LDEATLKAPRMNGWMRQKYAYVPALRLSGVVHVVRCAAKFGMPYPRLPESNSTGPSASGNEIPPRRLQGAALFLLGLVLLVIGVILPLRAFEVPIISVFGFLVMFAGAVIAVLGGRKRGKAGSEEPTDASGRGSGRSSFTQRMENRFRRRFEEQ